MSETTRTKAEVLSEITEALEELVATDIVLTKAQEKMNVLQAELRGIIISEGEK